MAGYNRTRYVEQLLEKTESLPPSFTVHLHPEYWVLNNGSKFLYHNQIASLLDDIRAQRIPVDFLELFDSARVPFYDGCMVVELLDYRPQRSKEPALKVPERTRVVLHPNSETLCADICLMNRQNGAQWTDKDALEVEAKILLATSQPLCLDPDPHLTRIVNSVLRMSTPTMPPSLKRKAAAMEPEEDGPEKARRTRILSFMAPQNNKSHTPSYRILESLNAFRLKGAEAASGQASMAGHQYMNGVPRLPSAPQPLSQPTTSTPTPAPATASPMDVETSQPQHPQQLSPAEQQQQQQHYTQSPKLPVQSNATTPGPQPTSQSFLATQPTFPPPLPHSHFLQQPPPAGRNGPGAHPTNQQHQQALYAQSLQHQQLLSQQQNNSILIHQQRIAMAANVQRNAAATPQAQVQHPGQATTPSPVKNSPGVTHQQLVAAQAARSSPMPKVQLQQQQQHPLSAQQMQMQMQPHPNRVAFAPQYNSAQLRSLHGNPPLGHMVVPNQVVSTDSPTALGQNMTSSPGRPITPAMTSGDGKQQLGQVQGQMQGLLQQPLRRQTPQQQLQGSARAASQSRSPHTPQAQVKHQTPQLTNRTPQLQQRTPQQQLQQIQNQRSSPQVQAQAQIAQSQSQPQSHTQPQTQTQQIPGHPQYAQMFGYPQMNYQMPGAFWQQRSMQGMMPTSATPHQLLLMQQAQQAQQQQHQQQHQQQLQQQQQQQQQQPQQQQVNVVSQPMNANSQGSIPIMTNNQQLMLAYQQSVKLAGQQQQQHQVLMNMGKIPGQGGKVGQKKGLPKRGGGTGR